MRDEKVYGPRGIYVQVTGGLGLRQIVQDDERIFRVLGRKVKLSDPSPPFTQMVNLEPDASRGYEDSLSANYAIRLLVMLCARNNLRTIGKNTGFVIWGSQRKEVSEHLLERDDYVAKRNVHAAGIQFFRYRFVQT